MEALDFGSQLALMAAAGGTNLGPTLQGQLQGLFLAQALSPVGCYKPGSVAAAGGLASALPAAAAQLRAAAALHAHAPAAPPLLPAQAALALPLAQGQGAWAVGMGAQGRALLRARARRQTAAMRELLRGRRPVSFSEAADPHPPPCNSQAACQTKPLPPRATWRCCSRAAMARSAACSPASARAPPCWEAAGAESPAGEARAAAAS